MKKNRLSAAIAVFMTLVSIPEARAQFGIYVGYQAARYTDNGKIDDKPFNGVRLELDYTWMFGKYFGTGIGAGYSFDTRDNGSYAFPGEVLANFSTQEQYVYIPLKLKINLPISGDVAFELSGGPSLSYALAGSDTFDFTHGLDNPLSFTYDMYADRIESDDLPSYVIDVLNSSLEKSRYERFGIDMTAGAGLRISKNVRIEGAMSWYMTNQLKKSAGGKLSRRLWTAGVSFLF